ncbi:ATP synthase F1 subunit delta [Lachnospiraceae bacterium 54-53]
MNREAYIGKGLFEAAKEESVLDRAYDEISSLKACLAENPEFLCVLCSPFLSVPERISILDKVFGGHVQLLVLNALKVLYEKKTRCSFEVFSSAFLREYEKERGVLRVKAYSARPLSEDEEELLKRKLELKTGKTVIMQLFIDEKVLGGLRYEYDNMIFDGSVEGGLLHLKDMIVGSPLTELDRGVN